MSWDVYLTKNGKPVEVNRHCEGGIYAVGGSTEADLNVTYNYNPFYYQFLDKEKGLRWLDQKITRDCTHRLYEAIKKLGTNRDKNYWASTPGNAGYALVILLDWAKEHPDAIFEVS
ncbi:MAG: hypothetical protein AAB907_00750 [Patescibacteria group bacterium]